VVRPESLHDDLAVGGGASGPARDLYDLRKGPLGCPEVRELQPYVREHAIRAPYEIEHRSLLRDELRIIRGRAFCNDREIVVKRTGQEDDVPGLPEPVWDYVTVPY